MTTLTTRLRLPSMKDVAKRAGVSQTTVSFVINNIEGANIPEETQARVWAAIEELGYRRNANARNLRSNRTNTIGFISDVVVTTPFAGQIIQGAQDAAWEHEYLLLVVNTGNKPDVEQAALNMLLERRVDGILYATMYHRPVSPPPQIREVPTVLLDCFVEDRTLPSVVPDEVCGGYEATEILLKQGHCRIGHMTNVEVYPARSGRIQGYKQALADYGVAFDPELIVEDVTDPDGGYRAAKQLMALENPPTAIFCFNDRMAMGTYELLRELMLKIPDDVAITSFDNQELLAAHMRPSLTTMQLPHYAMGQWAVNYLLNGKNQNYPSPSPQITLNCPLILRESHGKSLNSHKG